MKKKPSAVTCLFLVSVAMTAAADEILTAEQVQETLPGNTLEYLHKGKKVVVLVESNGKLSARMRERKNKGKWRINDEGHWCRTWKKWLKGKEGCFEVVHKKGNDYEFRWKSGQGGSNVKVKLLEGNPKKL